MITKNTLFYGDNPHVCQEIFVNVGVLFLLEGQKITITFLTQVTGMWLEISSRLYVYSEEDLQVGMKWLQQDTEEEKDDDTDS